MMQFFFDLRDAFALEYNYFADMMLFFFNLNRIRYSVKVALVIPVVTSGWRILHHVIAALTMMKMVNISTKNETYVFLFDTYLASHVPMGLYR